MAYSTKIHFANLVINIKTCVPLKNNEHFESRDTHNHRGGHRNLRRGGRSNHHPLVEKGSYAALHLMRFL